MKAIRVTSFGGPEALKLEEIDRPQPGADQALVRIAAVGINFIDVYRRSGRSGYAPQLPYTPGSEGAGSVEAVGRNVNNVRVGDRVAYTGIPGSYAEFVAAPADRLIKLPDRISFEEGASFPLQGMTAHYLIHEFYHVASGTTVLIHAAAGGVGLLLTQMASHIGARVIATTSTDEKAAIAKAAGARDVILYTNRTLWTRSRS